MRKRIIWAAGLALVVAAGCNDRSRASNDVKWNDRPADISCWTYGVQSFEGRSTGRVGYDEGGRISFVDAANGRYTTVEGDCRVVYRMADDDQETMPVTLAAPPPPSADQASAQ